MKRPKHVPLSKIKIRKNNLLLFLIGISVFFSCENRNENIEKFASQEEDFLIVYVEDYNVNYFDSAKLKAYFFAPIAKKFDKDKDDYMEFPDGLRMTRLDSNKNETSKLTCNYAIYYEDDDLWEARRNVVVVNSEKDTIKTELMFWDVQKQKVYSDKFVQIYKPNRIIRGIGFEANEDFENYKIFKPKGTIYVEK